MRHDIGGQTRVILDRLQNVKKSGDGWMCSCPSHGGNDCLTVSDEDGKTLIHCFAGCDTGDVMAAIGLSLRDLFADSLNPERKREYQIRSAQKARSQARLILEIAEAQALASDLDNADLATLADAHDLLNTAERQLKELGALDAPEEDDNPLLKWLSYDSDAALDRIASQQWLIDQILPVDGFGVIYGPSGSYKSFVAMDISASIASSKQWHGNDIDNPGHVIYIGAEGATGLHLRKKAWEIRHGTQLKNLAILGTAVTINSAMERQHLINMCEVAANDVGEPIKLIVIDTLARSFDGEENSASDMGMFVRACDHIRAVTGATVLVIHHSGKDADKGARGSSALRAACDFEFKVVSTGKKVTKLTCTKAKDSDPFDDMTFKLNVVQIGRQDQKGRELSSLTLTPANDADGGAGTRDDLTGHAQTLNNLIGHELARSGNDSVTTEFMRDTFYHRIGNKDRKAFSRAIEKLTQDEWIYVDPKGNISRDLPF